MSQYDVFVKNGIIVTETGEEKVDFYIQDGKIAKIGMDLSEDESVKKIIDASGLHIFPGLIDSHVHFNEPGRTDWEGIETGSKSLAAGGVTTFFDMPLNSNPPTINEQAFNAKNTIAKQKSVTDYRLWGGVVPQNIGQLKELKELGVIGFKAFMSNSGIDDFHASDDNTLFMAMKEISELNSLLAVHAESDTITAQLGQQAVEQGETSAQAFSDARPIYSEIEAVQRVIAYAKATNCQLHIVHASSSQVVDVITTAKEAGVDVTVETCPHYLSLTVADLEELGAIAKCAPPLRSAEEVDNLWNSLKNGEIDVIGSDHSPSIPSMKAGGLFEAWGGIPGAQSTLNVLLEEGYWKREVPLSTIARVAATNPAKRFGLYPQKGTILEGSDADLTFVNLNQSFVLNKEDLFYKHKQSPYIGKSFRGKVKMTLLRGKCIYENK